MILKFIPNRLALITLISACIIILISMGLRQTFGLFFKAFEEGIGCTRTEFGFAIGIQMLFWGMFAPLGIIADKFGGNKAVFLDLLSLVWAYICSTQDQIPVYFFKSV